MAPHFRLLVILVCSLMQVGWVAAADKVTLEAIGKRLDKLAEKQLSRGVASISVALVKDGKVVLKKAWGYSNVWSKTPARPETIYCTGSTFKAVTATAILQLAEQGKLSLDDPANEHLGESPIVADKENGIKVRHLLDHTSGLTPGASTKDVWSRKLPDQLEELPAKLKLTNKPGTKWEYNNHAYAIAGLIIETVSGESYEEFVVKHILKPLGVKTSGPIFPTARMQERMAIPYIPGPDKSPKPVPFVSYDVFPAGDIYLTAEDMARFLSAHLNGGEFGENRILTAKSVASAHKTHLNNYALGWGVTKQNGETLISHGGGVPGFRSHMSGVVEAKVGVYVMSNSGNMAPFAKVALQMLLGKEYIAPADRKAVDLSSKLLGEYVGTYRLGNAVLTLRARDKQLTVQLTGQQEIPFFAEGKDRLFTRLVDAQLSVRRDKNGKVDAVTLHQNGVDQLAPKIVEKEKEKKD